jgi:tRNA(Arg) A34 adenosine deaminase TadA
MSNKHARHINAAINAAMNSTMHQMHGAVLVRGGKRISVGYNTIQTRFQKENVPSIHAEIAALQSLTCRNAREPKERLLQG